MSGRHDRSVSAAATTIQDYVREIRSIMASGDEFHSGMKGWKSSSFTAGGPN